MLSFELLGSASSCRLSSNGKATNFNVLVRPDSRTNLTMRALYFHRGAEIGRTLISENKVYRIFADAVDVADDDGVKDFFVSVI